MLQLLGWDRLLVRRSGELLNISIILPRWWKVVFLSLIFYKTFHSSILVLFFLCFFRHRSWSLPHNHSLLPTQPSGIRIKNRYLFRRGFWTSRKSPTWVMPQLKRLPCNRKQFCRSSVYFRSRQSQVPNWYSRRQRCMDRKFCDALYILWSRYFPVCTQRYFNVHTTSFQHYGRCIDVETTSCAGWVLVISWFWWKFGEKVT